MIFLVCCLVLKLRNLIVRGVMLWRVEKALIIRRQYILEWTGTSLCKIKEVKYQHAVAPKFWIMSSGPDLVAIKWREFFLFFFP